MNADIAEQLQQMVEQATATGKELRWQPEARLVEDLGLDSMDMVELVMSIEEVFGLVVPDDAADRLITVGDVVGFIEEAQAKGP